MSFTEKIAKNTHSVCKSFSGRTFQAFQSVTYFIFILSYLFKHKTLSAKKEKNYIYKYICRNLKKAFTKQHSFLMRLVSSVHADSSG